MYSPSYNQVRDRVELLQFLRANNFPTLVTGTGGVLHASHLPITVHEEGAQIVIDMHMAKNNPQWQEFFVGEMSDEVMVIFAGPHAYVSPRWYADQERVPTWNYAAVHAYGIPEIIYKKEEKMESQRRLVESLDPEWLPKFDALRQPYVDQMLEGIVNFSIPVSRLETRWKLSQNRGQQEMELIAAELEKSDDTGERALAALTRRHFPA